MLKNFTVIIVLMMFVSCQREETSNQQTYLNQNSTDMHTKIEETIKSKDSLYKKHRFIWSEAGVSFAYYLDVKKNKDNHQDISYYYDRLPPFVFDYREGSFAYIDDFQNKNVPSSFYRIRKSYENNKHGYIRAWSKNPKDERQIEVVLFTSKNKAIIVVNRLNSNQYPVFLNFKKDFDYHDKANTWQTINDGQFFPEINQINDSRNIFFKLPEYGTTILACRDTAKFIADPDKFWADKQQHHPKEIIKIDWNVKQGRFFVK